MLPWMNLFVRYRLMIKDIIPAIVMQRVETRQLVISPSIIEVRAIGKSLTQHLVMLPGPCPTDTDCQIDSR
jgi:hypothetical protein